MLKKYSSFSKAIYYLRFLSFWRLLRVHLDVLMSTLLIFK
ncbi:hypothetical protein IGJ28_002091 [Enterococcus sp. AZ091]